MTDILVVGANLLFLSKIQEAAKSKGLGAQPVALAEAVERAREPRWIIVDLERVSAADAASLVTAGGRRVIGFASHGEAALFDLARTAGLEPMSKGQLASQLSTLFEA